MPNKGPDDHTLLTVNGRTTLWRRRYSHPDLGSHCPLDSWIDRLEDTVSLGLREMACRLNLDSRDFDRAADNLARAAQVRLSGEVLRQIVESDGKAIQAAAKAGRLAVAWDQTDCPAVGPDGEETDQTRVYLGSDGVMVPVITQDEKDQRRANVKANRRRRGKKCKPLPRAKKGADGSYKEFKIVTLYDDQAEHRLVSVTSGDCQVAGRIMRRDCGRVGLDKADDKGGVVDGSAWISNQIRQQSIPLDDLGLDFYHLAENVHQARRAVYGEEDGQDEQAPGYAWAAKVLHTAKHEGCAALRDELEQWCQELARGKKAAKRLLNYVSERDQMILYPQFQAVGRQIGSGPTESMCKATTGRIKGRGKRWDIDNAEALMALEALHQSGGWEDYWASFLLQAA